MLAASLVLCAFVLSPFQLLRYQQFVVCVSCFRCSTASWRHRTVVESQFQLQDQREARRNPQSSSVVFHLPSVVAFFRNWCPPLLSTSTRLLEKYAPITTWLCSSFGDNRRLFRLAQLSLYSKYFANFLLSKRQRCSSLSRAIPGS